MSWSSQADFLSDKKKQGFILNNTIFSLISTPIQAFELDITRDLQAYEIEYHVIGEELATLESSHQQVHPLQHNNRNNPLHPNHPQHPLHHNLARGPPPLPAMERPSRFLNRRRSSIDFELMYRMEHQNRALKLQNSELVEKLQVLHL